MSQYDGLKDKRILLVEDVELNQYLARHIIESWGCVVEVVDNGSIAVERVGEGNFDLVLMDIQMPVMDGIEATKKIRGMKDKNKSSIPIVALTANALKSECETYMQIGMNDWLAKPFEEPALYKTISKNIRQTTVMITAEVKEKNESGALYNLSMIESISGGDKSFIEKMLVLFLETVPKTLNDLKVSADEGDWPMLSKHAHKLKSTIDSMGISSLKQDIRDIELDAKTGTDPERLRALTAKVLEVMERVMGEIRVRGER